MVFRCQITRRVVGPIRVMLRQIVAEIPAMTNKFNYATHNRVALIIQQRNPTAWYQNKGLRKLQTPLDFFSRFAMIIQ